MGLPDPKFCTAKATSGVARTPLRNTISMTYVAYRWGKNAFRHRVAKKYTLAREIYYRQRKSYCSLGQGNSQDGLNLLA